MKFVKALYIPLIMVIITSINCSKKLPEANFDDVIDITASSTLKSKNDEYNVSNFTKVNGSWCEGKNDSGIGETLTFKLSAPHLIKEIEIVNGLGNLKYYKSNNRVKKLEITGDLGGKETITLKDSSNRQLFDVNNKIKGKTITFKILEVYKGDKWDDTCINLIQFLSSSQKENVQPKEEKSVVGEKPKAASKKLEFPLEFEEGELHFTLYEDGSVKGKGKFKDGCDSTFENGKWRKGEEGVFIVTYEYSFYDNCADKDARSPGNRIYENDKISFSR